MNSTTSSDSVTRFSHKVAPWQGVTIGQHQLGPGEFEDYLSPLYAVDVHLSHPYTLEWKQGKRYQRTAMAPGAICVATVDELMSMRWRDHLEILKVALTPALLASTAESMNLRGDITILERHGDTDVQIVSICQALWAEYKAGYPLGRVFGESLGTALASCLLQRYSDMSAAVSAPGKLPPRVWKRVQDFIEEQLHNDISLEEMANLAQLSPYYFARCFKETAGTSPHQYLIARRVERARQLLEGANLSLAQVAIQSGFSDQSHLTRHMKRILGQTPNALLPRRNTRKVLQ